MKKIYYIGLSVFFLSVFFFLSCKKKRIDPDIYGEWVMVDHPANDEYKNEANYPCKLVIGYEDITLCNSSIILEDGEIDPIAKVRIYCKDGQIRYKAKIFFIGIEEYLYDYDFEGDNLWLKNEKTEVKTNALNEGMLFRRI